MAGYRGLALFNVATNRWRVFGNLQHVRCPRRRCLVRCTAPLLRRNVRAQGRGNLFQERDFRVTGGLAWCGEILVAACQELNSGKHEVRRRVLEFG